MREVLNAASVSSLLPGPVLVWPTPQLPDIAVFFALD